MPHQRCLSLASLLLALLACRASPPAEPAAPAEPTAPAEPAAPPAPAALSGGLVATPPAAWTPRPTTSAMRVAEYEVGAESGAPATLVVYHFEGAGGTVEQNFERWAGQFTAPDGGPATPRRLALADRRGLAIHELALEGTYVAEVSPGAEERHHERGWALRAAVVETPGGPFYVKLVGPEATVRAAEADWNRYLASCAFEEPR